VARGWTVKEFSQIAKLDVGSVYNAIQGKAVRDATAIGIFTTLEKRPPMMTALD
jgi:predicted transcriptional regulator